MAPAPYCVAWVYLRTCIGASTLFFWSKPYCVIGAYFLTCIGGWLFVAVCLWGMRLLALKKGNRPPLIVLKRESRPPLIDWMGLFGGVIERFVALTLVLMAPTSRNFPTRSSGSALKWRERATRSVSYQDGDSVRHGLRMR
jgi:hypothetical protein